MRSLTKGLKICFSTAIAVGCGLLVANHAQAQIIYSISADTGFGENLANSGDLPPTFVDNMDGTFTLSNGAASGANNAVFLDSSDGGSVSTILGRALTSDDIIIVSGTVVSGDVNYNANGVEFGLQSAVGFRSAPNLLLQIDAGGDRGGFAPFFGTPTPGENVNRVQTPGVTETGLNDGYTFVATYSATDIVYTVTDIVTLNEIGDEPVEATSFTFSFSDAVAADDTLQASFDDYVANFPTLVGDSFAYFSHQKTGPGAFSSVLSNFEISLPTTGTGVPGDANCDGVVNFDDIAPFIMFLSSGEFKAEADLDGNEMVDFDDISPFITALSGS